MGQTILLIVILGVASAALEGIMLAKFKPLSKLLLKYPLLSLPTSFVLSFILGLAFGAHGTIVLGAGILSTVLMQPVYWLSSKINQWWTGRNQSSSVTAQSSKSNPVEAMAR